jgi:hypothetical protein
MATGYITTGFIIVTAPQNKEDDPAQSFSCHAECIESLRSKKDQKAIRSWLSYPGTPGQA